MSFLLALILLISSSITAAPAPRMVQISGQMFINATSKQQIVMSGANVVVKGPPYLPAVTGDTFCNDIVNSECTAHGNCTSCETFNQADIDNMKAMGWNAIRLGVVWAGAQPEDTNSLDSDFIKRLHAILTLCDANNLPVMLDNHGDMVGTAGCGNGVPMWIQKKAVGDLIGKPLTSAFPYSYFEPVEKVDGYDHCGANETMWAKHAGSILNNPNKPDNPTTPLYLGDPNYNLLNECCQAMNSPNPGGLGFSTISQQTMDYILKPGEGRDAFVRFWQLLALEVVDHPSAFAAELMNEPMSIERKHMYDTWRACAEAIHLVIPDMSVALSDIGEGAVVPSWLSDLYTGIGIDGDTIKWIKNSSYLYYAWHYYGNPKLPSEAIRNARAIEQAWNVPSFLTEFMSCDAWNNATADNISFSYWHYSSYCTTGAAFGNRRVPEDTFGACILGWAGGNSQKTC